MAINNRIQIQPVINSGDNLKERSKTIAALSPTEQSERLIAECQGAVSLVSRPIFFATNIYHQPIIQTIAENQANNDVAELEMARVNSGHIDLEYFDKTLFGLQFRSLNEVLQLTYFSIVSMQLVMAMQLFQDGALNKDLNLETYLARNISPSRKHPIGVPESEIRSVYDMGVLYRSIVEYYIQKGVELDPEGMDKVKKVLEDASKREVLISSTAGTFMESSGSFLNLFIDSIYLGRFASPDEFEQVAKKFRFTSEEIEFVFQEVKALINKNSQNFAFCNAESYSIWKEKLGFTDSDGGSSVSDVLQIARKYGII